MSIIFVLQQHDDLVLDGRDLATGVEQDLETAHIDRAGNTLSIVLAWGLAGKPT